MKPATYKFKFGHLASKPASTRASGFQGMAVLGLAAAARGQEHRDEAERMKEAAQKILRRHQAPSS
jgi:hypothetical protein